VNEKKNGVSFEVGTISMIVFFLAARQRPPSGLPTPTNQISSLTKVGRLKIRLEGQFLSGNFHKNAYNSTGYGQFSMKPRI